MWQFVYLKAIPELHYALHNPEKKMDLGTNTTLIKRWMKMKFIHTYSRAITISPVQDSPPKSNNKFRYHQSKIYHQKIE